MLPSFRFSRLGKCIISVEIVAQLFIPLGPVFANFSAAVSPTADGNLEIKLST